MSAALRDCLGGPWPEPCPLAAEVTDVDHPDGEPFTRERLTYMVEPGERVSAFLLVPVTATAQCPAPGITLCHQHAGQYDIGKSEPAGLAGDPMHHTGVALARQGFVVLCPDALCFEERQIPRKTEDHYATTAIADAAGAGTALTDEGGLKTGGLKGGDLERFEFLRYIVDGRSLAWKSILDFRRSVDYMVSRPEVDENRIGTYGHSMGSTHVWLGTPHEPRITCAVGNCCMPSYSSIERVRLLHCFPNFIPGWRQLGRDIPHAVAEICPRALHLNFGELDTGSPIEEVREGIDIIAEVFAAAGATDNFTAYIEEGAGHVLSEEMWARTLAFFQKHLGLARAMSTL